MWSAVGAVTAGRSQRVGGRSTIVLDFHLSGVDAFLKRVGLFDLIYYGFLFYEVHNFAV